MKTYLTFAVGLLLTLGARADGRVDLHIAQAAPVPLTGISTLQDLVTRPELHDYSWWSGSVIAEKQATEQQLKQKQQLLTRLSELATHYQQNDNAEAASAVKLLSQHLASIAVTGRQFVPLDPDWIRLHPVDNRRLEGEYSLYVTKQPDTVEVVGLISPQGKQPFQVASDVAAYLEKHPLLPGSNPDHAWVISPEGKVTKLPIAYWNQRHNEVMPGSLIFIGFSSLPDTYRDLNQQIISLLTHRIPD